MKLKFVTATVGVVSALTFPLMASISPARAADGVLVRGTIVSAGGSMLTVKTREGATAAVALEDGWKLTGVAEAALDDIKPGEFIGIASVPSAAGEDGAVEVLVFPTAFQGASEGSYPWDLKPQSTIMTNATVSYAVKDIDGRTVTLSYHGRDKKIAIADGTPIVAFAPATQTNLVVGAPVFIPAERDADGALAAAFVIVGANGVVPPM
jgi:hypothetical protein